LLAALVLEAVGMDRPGGLSAIGNTPVTRLARMAGDGDAEVWMKMEAANPTGSYKDRMALAMIEAAEASGRRPASWSWSTPAGAPARPWRSSAR
jgi:threonine synthase